MPVRLQESGYSGSVAAGARRDRAPFDLGDRVRLGVPGERVLERLAVQEPVRGIAAGDARPVLRAVGRHKRGPHGTVQATRRCEPRRERARLQLPARSTDPIRRLQAGIVLLGRDRRLPRIAYVCHWIHVFCRCPLRDVGAHVWLPCRAGAIPFSGSLDGERAGRDMWWRRAWRLLKKFGDVSLDSRTGVHVASRGPRTSDGAPETMGQRVQSLANVSGTTAQGTSTVWISGTRIARPRSVI